MSKSHWHYPRTEFAQTVFAFLAKGPVQGVSLFGPRRTGKTQFLLNDLGPLAEQEGHQVVYVNFMQPASPLPLLLREMDLSLRETSFAKRMQLGLSNLAARFTIRVPVAGGELSVDMGQNPKSASQDQYIALDALLARLSDAKRPLILLLDEFQELGSKDHLDLIAALRASLDKRRDSISSVFTGSSLEGLQRVFSSRSAPFFRFATPLDLPGLDARFVDHQLEAFRSISKRALNRAEVVKIFEQSDRNPLVFQRWLMALAVRPDLSPADALSEVQRELAAEFGFEQIWIRLSATQRVVARLVADRVGQIYGREGALAAKALTDRPGLATSDIQSALRRLRRLAVVDRWDETWRIGDPLLESWIRDRPVEEF